MQALRVATLGAGYFSQFHHRAWCRMEDVELVGVCDSDGAEARAAAGRYGIASAFTALPEMLHAASPAVLDVITPPATHLAAITMAAERGIDIICQKPFCGDLATAERAVAIAEAAGVRLIVHENFRFQPWYGKLKSLVDDGFLGRVHSAVFRLRPGDGQGPQAYLDRQPYFQQMPRFMIHETGVHYVDVFRFLFGEVSAVIAKLRRLNPAIAGEDAGIVLLEMVDGVHAVLDGNRLSDHKATNRRRTLGEMLIEGEQGALRLTGDGEILLRRHGSDAEELIDYPWRDEEFGGDCVYLTQRAAADALMGRRQPVNLARDYLTNLRIEEAIYASDNEGRRVAVAQRATP